MGCFQPMPKKSLADSIVDTAAKYFGIEGEDEKCNLKLLFELYANIKFKDAVSNVFSPKNNCEMEK